MGEHGRVHKAKSSESEKEGERKKRITEYIYVCAPLAGNVVENHTKAVKAVKKLEKEWKNSHNDNILPLFIVPHLFLLHITYDFIAGEIDRKWGMACCLSMVRMCDSLIVVGKNITMGMREEIEYALILGKKVERREDL